MNRQTILYFLPKTLRKFLQRIIKFRIHTSNNKSKGEDVMKKAILFITIILLLPLFTSQEVTASNFSATFELDFFNKDPNIFTTETFRRYHQLDLNYQFWENFFISFTYNWCDNVTSSISAHEITP